MVRFFTESCHAASTRAWSTSSRNLRPSVAVSATESQRPTTGSWAFSSRSAGAANRFAEGPGAGAAATSSSSGGMNKNVCCTLPPAAANGSAMAPAAPWKVLMGCALKMSRSADHCLVSSAVAAGAPTSNDAPCASASTSSSAPSASASSSPSASSSSSFGAPVASFEEGPPGRIVLRSASILSRSCETARETSSRTAAGGVSSSDSAIRSLSSSPAPAASSADLSCKIGAVARAFSASSLARSSATSLLPSSSASSSAASSSTSASSASASFSSSSATGSGASAAAGDGAPKSTEPRSANIFARSVATVCETSSSTLA
mmetsp:Transcript_8242/g.27120  ORF Transcript_8242/g.27120 Transcript_8242/m.27120 type:complete len:319 (-) Transcript_8242:175-1131(-)